LGTSHTKPDSEVLERFFSKDYSVALQRILFVFLYDGVSLFWSHRWLSSFELFKKLGDQGILLLLDLGQFTVMDPWLSNERDEIHRIVVNITDSVLHDPLFTKDLRIIAVHV